MWSNGQVRLQTTIKNLKWISFFLRKTLNSRLRKTHGKKGMEKIWKIMWWSALLPKIKTRWPSLPDPGNTHHPHFLRTLGGGAFHVMCAHLRPVRRNDNLAWLGSVRRLDCQLDQLHPSRSIDRRCRLDWAHTELNARSSTARPRARELRSRRATAGAADAPHMHTFRAFAPGCLFGCLFVYLR